MGWLEDELEKWQEANKDKFRADPKPTETYVKPEDRTASSDNELKADPFLGSEFEATDPEDKILHETDLSTRNTLLAPEIKNINPNYLDANTVANIEVYKHYAERKPLDNFGGNAKEFQESFGLSAIYNEFNKASGGNFTPETFHKFILETPLDVFKDIHNDYKSNEYAQLVQSNTELQLAQKYGSGLYTLSVDSILDEKKTNTDFMEVILNKIIPFVDPFDEKSDFGSASNRTEIRGDGLVTQLYYQNREGYEAIIKDSINEYLGAEYDLMPVDIVQETSLGAESDSPSSKQNYVIVNKETGTYSYLYQDGLTDDMAAVGNSMVKDLPMWLTIGLDIAIMSKLRGVRAYGSLFATGAGYSIGNDLLNDYWRFRNIDYTDPSGGGIQWGKSAIFGGVSVVATAVLGGIPKAKYDAKMFMQEGIVGSDSVAIAKKLQEMDIDPATIMSVGDFYPVLKALEKQVNAITNRGDSKNRISQKAFQEHFNLLNIIANGKVDIKALNLTDDTFNSLFFLNEQAILSELKRKGLKVSDLGGAELQGGTYLRKLIDNYNSMNQKITAEGYDQIRLGFRNIQDEVSANGNTIGFVVPSETKKAIQDKINFASFSKVREVKQVADDGTPLPSEYVEGQINLSLFDDKSQALIKNIFGIEDATTTFGKLIKSEGDDVKVLEGLFVGEGQNIFTSILKLKQNMGNLIRKEQVNNGYASSSAVGQQATEIMTILDGIITPNNFKQFNKAGDEIPLDKIVADNIDATLTGLNSMNQFYKHNAKLNEMAIFKQLLDDSNADKLVTSTWREMVENKSMPEKAELFDSLFSSIKNLNDKDIDRIFPIDKFIMLDGVEVSVRDLIFPDKEAFKKMTSTKKTDKIISYIQDSFVETITKRARYEPDAVIKELEAIRANDNLLFKTLVGGGRADDVLVALDTYARQLKNLNETLVSSFRGQEINPTTVMRFINEGKVDDIYKFWLAAGKTDDKAFQNYISSNYVTNKLSGIISGSGKDTVIDFGKATTKIDQLFKEIGKSPDLQKMIGEDAIKQLTNLRFVFNHMTRSSDAGTSLIAAQVAAAVASPEHTSKWLGAILDITRYNLIGSFIYSEKVSKKVIDNAINGISIKKSKYYENWHNQFSVPAIHSTSIEFMNLQAHFGTLTSELHYDMERTYENIRNDLGLYSTEFPTSDAEDKIGYTNIPPFGRPADLFPPLNNKPKIKNIFEEDEVTTPLRR